MHDKLLKPYNPKETEERIYKLWENSGFFNPDVCVEKGITKPDAPHFSMALPPPNVTGNLHTGHALMLVIQDIMIRHARMQGKKTLWLPGTDHAAIATQVKVEKLLEKEGIHKNNLGREKFLKRVEAFAKNSHDSIVNQCKKLGASLDWSREAFTMDVTRDLAVKTAFKKMYDDSLVYRGHRIVNWDPKGQTVISDDEIVYEERKGKFYTFKYGPFEIGTARPETKFGDKYVVMHPDDKRYKKWNHGDKLTVEWINGPIETTIIKDEMIDMEFGTGVMTITPWHSHEDFLLAEKYKLYKEQIIDKFGKLLPITEGFAGMKINEAREKVVEKLKEKGLLVRVDENYVNRVATAERSGGIIEPQIMLQWFVDVNKKTSSRNNKSLKELMLEPVREGKIKIIPSHFEKVYFNWIENLRDWCISRQIWYGHRIPVWYKKKETGKKMGFAGDIVTQVLDTKTKTYRLRDHDLSVGDEVAFEDSSTGNIFGYGKITKIEKTIVGKVDLQDKKHWRTYKKREDLIKAFKRHHPEKEVTESTPVWLYTYEFTSPIYCGIEPPKGEDWVRDEDTLDTWFSSGLWTFSTLGWPKQTKDLETYHPTSVLETGHDILFFWVARMILMSQYLLGEVPFENVYLHGMVRTTDGKKMSKSLGEKAIDPLDITKKYGNDALRMAMVIGNTPGNDLKLDENDIRGYGKFTNKIWNVSRFVLEQIKDLDIKNLQKLDKEDKKSAEELNNLIKDITKEMDEYKFYIVAEKLYHYFWHTFADIIIERSKKKIIENKNSDSAKALLYTHLTTLLKFLHPFTPFVTEEIWSMIPAKNKSLLIVEKWPASAEASAGKPND